MSESQRRRPARSLVGAILRRLALGLAVFSAVVAVIVIARNVLTDWDRIEIEAERARRLAQAVRARRLPAPPTSRTFQVG